ncbi:CpsD/CapB family tyrosine-protein kinase [Thermoproteus tenax]|nr:CpsD/CapB family tyrosine-protein kinase [Thermoproteus tenax]
MGVKFAIVYSVDGGVGKTTLATAIALEKERVLLIDADWEKADLSALFGAPRRPGWLSGYYGKDVYLHKVKPNIYLLPGFDAAALYQRGDMTDAELFDALFQVLSALPDAVAEERLPVDTIVVDTPKAPQLTWIEKLQRRLKAQAFFIADRRLVVRLADVKMQIYGKYMRYASLVVANMLEKEDEKMPGIKMMNAYLNRVKMPSEYTAEAVHKSLLSNRRNKEAVRMLVRWIKER